MPGGKIDLIGGVDNSDDRETLAARLTEAGALDPSFGSGGAVVTTLRPREEGQLLFQFSEAEHVGGLAVGSSEDEFEGLTVDSAGRAIAVGGTNYGTLVERFQGEPAPATSQTPSSNAPTHATPPPSSLPVSPPKIVRVRFKCTSVKASLASKHRTKCMLVLTYPPGHWSAMEVVIRRGADRIYRSETHRLRTHPGIQFSLPSGGRHTYTLTVLLRHGHRALRFTIHVVLPLLNS